MRPNSYIIQSGCYNCANVFRMSEYDSPDTYFCHIDKSERPKCGSVSMRENWDHLSSEFYGDQWDLWDAWAVDREVASWGICDNWELKKSE